MHCESEFTSQCHPTFARGHKNGLWPFSAIFRDRFIHVFMQQNRPLAGLECGKNGILPFFWSFLAIWGYIPNPRAPSTSSYPLTLTPTLTVSKSRKILTFKIKEFSFFSWFLVHIHPQPHLAKCHPLGGAPEAIPCSYQFFHLYSVSMQWVLPLDA